MAQRTRPKTKYIDRPDVVETYADSLGMCTFEDGVFRLELTANRYDEPKPPAPPTGRRYPVVRVAMPVPAVVRLFNHLNQMMNLLQQRGIVKEETGPVTIQ